VNSQPQDPHLLEMRPSGFNTDEADTDWSLGGSMSLLPAHLRVETRKCGTKG
jgi:hypothetical protein